MTGGGGEGTNAKWKDFVAGTVAGVSLVLAGHPMDTIKVRLQTSEAGRFKGPIDCVIKTVRREGLRALYKGVGSPLTGVPWQYTLSFGARGVAQSLLKEDTLVNQWLAGGISGVFTSVVTSPVEMVKAKMQIQYNVHPSEAKYRNVFHCAQVILREEGFRGLFRGFSATLLRDIPGSAAYFGFYETYKHWMKQWKQSKGQDVNLLDVLFCGGFAGVSAWGLLFPCDLIKSRVQTAEGDPRSIASVVKEVYQTGGFKGFYRGLSASVMRAFPADAASFFGYEATMKLISSIR